LFVLKISLAFVKRTMRLSMNSFLLLSTLPLAVLSLLGGGGGKSSRHMTTFTTKNPGSSSSSPSSSSSSLDMKGMRRGQPHRGGDSHGESIGNNYNSKRKWNRSRTSHRSSRKENSYSPVGYQLGDMKNLKTMFEANSDDSGTLSYDSFIDSRYLRYW